MEIVGNGEAEMREGWRGSSSRSHVAEIQHDMSSVLVVLGLTTEFSSAQNGCLCM